MFRPQTTGFLHLYVNDAIGIWPFASRWRFYENNVGTARVVFEREVDVQPDAATPASDMPTIRIVELKQEG